jgi:putative peptidoglycan lipid II flippase
VTLTIVLGYLFALPLRAALGVSPRWGAAGLTISAGIAGWVEFALLRRSVNGRVGRTGIPRRRLLTLWSSAALAAVVALGVHALAPVGHPLVVGILVIGAYGLTYFASTAMAGVEDATEFVSRIRRRSSRRA